LNAARRGLAPAKVNLTLHVTGRRVDGFHLLDSLVAFADVGDILTVGPGNGLEVRGPFASGVPVDDANLIRRALSRAGARRAVRLDKRLPHPGGLGGGSSDAATALRLADAVLDVPQLLSLGADLPVCGHGRAARMRGIGEDIAPVAMPVLHAVLVNPGADLPTAAVFGGLSSSSNPAMTKLPESLDPRDWLAYVVAGRNDLEAPAIAAAPVVKDVLDALRRSGAAVARMSGSGATCFGLWPTRIAAEAAAAGLRREGWWVAASSLS
jgi:4-diphosphocytidyl-2-C-methyl-D-erythritol kinase